MQLVLHRKYRKEDYTIGRLYIDGKFFCNTLEDTDRGLTQEMSVSDIKARKVYGATAIPIGHYKVVRTHSPKYRRVMPLVANVKGYDGIRIHSGNTAKDTLGCILLGENTAKGMLTKSRVWCRRFEQLLNNVGYAELDIVWDYEND